MNVKVALKALKQITNSEQNQVNKSDETSDLQLLNRIAPNKFYVALDNCQPLFEQRRAS